MANLSVLFMDSFSLQRVGANALLSVRDVCFVTSSALIIERNNGNIVMIR